MLMFMWFTLLELLIVISIIAVLASLLLPALKTSMAKAKEVTCMSNLKQAGLATINYTNDFKEWFPPAQASPYTLQGYNKTDPTWYIFLSCMGYIPSPWNSKTCRTSVQCPSWRAWPAESACLNTYGRRLVGSVFSNMKNFTSYSKTIWYADSISYNITNSQYQTYAFATTGTSGYSYIHTRHMNKSNCWFLDAHVQSLNQAGLKDNDLNLHVVMTDTASFITW